MAILSSHLRKLDWGIITASVLLVGFGLSAIYSTSLAKSNFLNLEKQVVFFIVGFALMILISFSDYRILRNNSYLILILYGFCLLLLLGLHFFAPEIRGTRGWYKVGLLSNNDIAAANRFRETGLTNHFDVVVVSAEIGYSKPHTKAFEIFIERLGVVANELIYIDDTEKSLVTAKEIGYHPVLFSNYDSLLYDLKSLGVKI